MILPSFWSKLRERSRKVALESAVWNCRARAPVTFALWLVSAAFLAVILWQAAVGWPFHRRATIRLFPVPEIGADVYQGKLSPSVPYLDWNSPWTRVLCDQVEFVQRLDDHFLKSDAPASRVIGRKVLLRNPGSDIPPPQCELLISWLPRSGVLVWTCGAFCVLSALLLIGRDPWLIALRDRLRRLPWTAGLVIFVLVCAVLVRVFGFSFPSWEHDSNDYFRPVFQWLSGQPIGPTDRPLGYPILIAVLLRLFGDFRALVVVQHAASIGAGVALAGIFFGSARRLFEPGAWQSAAKVAGVVCVALFVFNERIIRREWQLLPEAMTAGWFAIELWVGWRLMTLRLPRWRTLLEFGCFCAAGWLVFFTKSNWGFALAFLPVPLVCLALLRSTTRREFAIWCGAGLAVLVAVSALAGLFQQLTPLNTLASVEIRSRVLVCWHAPMVRLEISRRLAAQPPPADAALLQDFADLLDTEFALAAEHGPGAYRSLHYDPDRLYYIGFQQARLYWRLTSTQRAAYCQGLFFDALRRHPDLYVRKVVAQMALYFRQPYAPANIRLGAIDRSLVLSEDLIAHPRPYVPAALLGRYQPVIERARLILSGSWVSPLRIAFSLRMVEAYALLNPLFAWLLGGPILLTVVSALWPTWRAAIPWRRMAPVLGLAIWATGSAVACALTSSVLQALEIQRYIDLFLPLTLFSELLWPLIGLSVALSFPKERSKAAAAS